MQRWVKFVKHLRNFGWEPVIYTPESPFVTEHDKTLLKEIPVGVEVLKLPVLEITKFFGAPTASNQSGVSPTLYSKFKKLLGSFVRGNFFIPDPRVLWVSPSVKFLSEYLSKYKIDAIVSTGPPNSMHLIALGIKEKFNIPWLADFRDPWMEVLKFHDFNISALAMKRHEQLFERVLKNADSIVTAHPSVKEKFSKQTTAPVTAITNGYDEEDLQQTAPANTNASKFNIVFVGILYDALNSTTFWEAIAELNKENTLFSDKLHLIFTGKVKEAAMRDLESFGLLRQSEFTGYVNHNIAISYEKAADILLLFTPDGEEFKYIIPGKLFEYLGVQKPVLCVAPEENDSAQIVLATKGGEVVSPTDKTAIKSTLLRMFGAFQKGELKVSSSAFEQYERKNLTARLVEVLAAISSK